MRVEDVSRKIAITVQPRITQRINPWCSQFIAGKYSLPPSNSEKTQGLFEGKVIDVEPTAEELRSK